MRSTPSGCKARFALLASQQGAEPGINQASIDLTFAAFPLASSP